MTIPEGWRNHLLATHVAIEEAIERMTRIAVNGRSPANHLLTPLPEADWPPIESSLARISQEFVALLESVAPEQIRNAREIQPFPATRYHLSLALMSLEQEILDDIDPDQPSRQGKLSSEDKDQIRSALVRMRAEIANIRSCIDRLSEPPTA